MKNVGYSLEKQDMIKKRLNVGIAGYGVVGKRRRQFIDQHPNLRTIAVCDQNFKESGIVHDGVRCFRDYHSLLEEPLDVLFVSLPNYLAAEVTMAGLERGLHVFCEKPPGRDVSDIKQVIDTETKFPELVLKYGFNHRYHDSVREALRIIKSGELGEIVNLRGVYGKSKILSFSGGWRAERKYAGGGILLDQGIHMLDLMRLFCGDFVEVKSWVSNSYWNHDVEDNAYALMRDSHGRVASLHSSATQWQHCFSLDITFTEGYLELRGILSGSKSYGEEKLIIGRRNESDTGTAKEEVITYLEDNSWRDEINEFADAVVNNGTVKHGNSSDALATMKLVNRIYWADPEWREAYSIPNPD
jgi:predicted dehydrogenase